jgi:hypothetical protein
MVRPEGLEPPTFCSEDRRSIQLSYRRAKDFRIVPKKTLISHQEPSAMLSSGLWGGRFHQAGKIP